MDTAIEVSHLHKTYQLGEVEIEVLKDINLTINRGEFVSIMGPSGSGKSTLLYLMGGLDRPTSGSIKVGGREIATMTDKEQSLMRRRAVGFIFQFYNLIPNLTVEENVLVPMLLDGKKGRECQAKATEILELVGLAERRRHTPRELSGGQQQRVAIARALVNDPEIILADEPTGNLDTKTGEGILNLMQRINAEKQKTIVQVTHSPEAAGYGKSVIQVRDGRIYA